VDTLAHWRRSFLSTDSRAADRASGQPASRTRTLAPAVRWRHGRKRAGFFTRNAALDWSGNSRSARPARWTSLFGADLWRASETKKARSVVALSRVPR
jgi:hypothetical protein